MEMGIREKGRRKRALEAIQHLRNWCIRAARQRYENEQLFLGRYSIVGTGNWGGALCFLSCLARLLQPLPTRRAHRAYALAPHAH